MLRNNNKLCRFFLVLVHSCYHITQQFSRTSLQVRMFCLEAGWSVCHFHYKQCLNGILSMVICPRRFKSLPFLHKLRCVNARSIRIIYTWIYSSRNQQAFLTGDRISGVCPSKYITQYWRRYYAQTTSFWRNYVKMTSFWRNNDVIITSCVHGGVCILWISDMFH